VQKAGLLSKNFVFSHGLVKTQGPRPPGQGAPQSLGHWDENMNTKPGNELRMTKKEEAVKERKEGKNHINLMAKKQMHQIIIIKCNIYNSYVF
jgi:hypothetical protein